MGKKHSKYTDTLVSYEDRQQASLQYALAAERAEKEEALARPVPVDEARAGETYYERASERDTTRILFISRDTSLLNPTQQTLDGYLDVSNVFDEVHIVVLRTGITPSAPVLRVAKNVWVYVAAARHWWWTPMVAERIIRDQLEFASGFRPDLIVARDPFECGLVAARVGQKFGRPTQVHVMENIADPDWVSADPANKWRKWFFAYVMRQFASVRTSSTQLQTRLQQRFSEIADIQALPRFNNYQALKTAIPTFDVKEKYRQFVFVILYVGKLDHDSTLYQALNAARFVLRNPRVGMVVVGDGAARKDFIKRTKLLGIEKQVVFERKVEDVVSYYKTADVLLVTDVDQASDEVAIRGAATGIPLLITPTTLRNDLFVDRQSALIAKDGRTAAISEQLSYFLNTLPIRRELKTGAAQVVATRLHEDPDIYRKAYRYSIESALLVGEYGVSDEAGKQDEAANTEVDQPAPA